MDLADPGRDALLAEQAGCLLWAGRLAEAEATCRALLSRDHDPSVTAGVRICLGHTLLDGGQAREALRELEGAVGSAAPASAELAIARALESFARLSLGDLDGASSAAAEARSADRDDALAQAQASVELAEEIGEGYAHVMGQTVRSLILLHRNDLGGARDAAEAAGAELAGAGPRFRSAWAQWARALVLEADGRAGQAYAVLAGCWDWCAEHGLALEYRVLGPDLIRLALTCGDPDRARAVAAAVTGLAEKNQVPSLTAAALRCQGLARGDAETLAAAAQACQSGPRPLELAGACEDAGAAFAGQGHPDKARPLLEQALEIYEGLDAGRDLARAEAVLRAAGIRRGRRGPRGRPKSGWASLTPAEWAVAGLVADGLTNPQIGARLYISRRTVHTHLAHVFAKLDIASRAQLAAQVTRHGHQEPPPGTATSSGHGR
jgi:DNA-binding CsgD family transcriptional regulator